MSQMAEKEVVRRVQPQAKGCDSKTHMEKEKLKGHRRDTPAGATAHKSSTGCTCHARSFVCTTRHARHGTRSTTSPFVDNILPTSDSHHIQLVVPYRSRLHKRNCLSRIPSHHEQNPMMDVTIKIPELEKWQTRCRRGTLVIRLWKTSADVMMKRPPNTTWIGS